MKITKKDLEILIKEAASEYVWGVKNPSRLANQYKVSTLKKIIKEELEAVTERCWDGYERVPNKREGEQGSCRKKGSMNEEESKVQKLEGIVMAGAMADRKDVAFKSAMQTLTKMLATGEYKKKQMDALKSRIRDAKHNKKPVNELEQIVRETFEAVLDEKKKKKKKKKAKKRDACYHKVKSRYDVWPSAYASGALVKCRKVGAKNWGKSTTKEELELYEGEESIEAKIRDILIEEGGAAGMKALVKGTEASEKEIKDAIKGMEDVGLHKDGDYILQDKKEIHVEKGLEEKKKKKAGTESGKEDNLGDWFGRKGEKGGKGGWVDCNAPDGDGGYKECAQGDRKKKPACRPTPGACKEKGKGKSWGKKAAKKESLEMNEELLNIIKEEMEGVLQEMENAYYDFLAEGETLEEAEYQGRKVTLNKPMRGDVKKSKVYVKNKKGNVVKVNFGDPNMKIRKSNPEARKSFRARHNCADKMKNPDKTTAGYWSCKAW